MFKTRFKKPLQSAKRTLGHAYEARLPIAKAGLAAGLLLTTSSCTTTMPVSARAVPQPTKPVIALVLGGGGAKGLAHVGVIKVLEASGLKPDLIVGSSVGSLVGSLYASGMTADALTQLALTTSNEELTDFTIAHQGIIEGIKLRDFVNAQVKSRPIEKLPIRFAAVATENNTQQKTVFTSGNTGLVVQASCSVPGIFIAPRIPEKVGKKYIDGGVTSLVPVDTARALGADVIIAVDVMTDETVNNAKAEANNTDHQTAPNIWSLMEEGYTSTYASKGKYAQSQAEVNRAEVIIRPNVAHISSIDTSRRNEAIMAGEAAAAQSLPAIAEAIANAVAKPSTSAATVPN